MKSVLKITTGVISGLAIGGVLSYAAVSQAAASTSLSAFSPAQQKQLQSYVQTNIQQYISNNPKAIIQSVQKMQMQQQQQTVAKGKQAAIENIDSLALSKTSPTVGPKNAPVTIVEFFDYQCSACHAMFPRMEQIIKNNPNVRYVYKEFPIFGPASEFAAKAAIAAQKQGKFLALHNALFNSDKMEGKLTNADVLAMAKKVGINIVKLQKDMQDPAIAQEMKNNYALASKLKLIGTPAFVIMPTPNKAKPLSAAQLSNKLGFVPGGVSASQIQELINKAKS